MRRADEAGRVVQEEGDLLRRDVLGRHDEVALVLAVLVVDDHHDLARDHGGDRLLDAREVVGHLGAARGALVGRVAPRGLGCS